MKLKSPILVREELLLRHGWSTIGDIAINLKTSPNTLSRAFRGKPVRMMTVWAIAQALGTSANEIATVVDDASETAKA